MTKPFDFKNIKRSDIFIGNINMITNVDEEMLEKLKFYFPNLHDYSSSCNTILAKQNVILLRVSDKYFIDIDSIKTLNDCNNINTLLENGSKNNNILLTFKTKEPFIGQLYINEIKMESGKISIRIDIMKLKLEKTQD